MTPVGNGTGTSTTSAGTTPTSTGSASAGVTTTTATDASSVASSTTASSQATATMDARQAAPAGFYVPPIVPTLPNNAVVGIWFGSNAASVTLTGNTGGCVNGLGDSVFGQVYLLIALSIFSNHCLQFAYCNGQAWFNAAKSAVSQGLIQLPAPGTGSGGQACPTTHDFRVVDQVSSSFLP